MKKFKERMAAREGFTLVELIVVIAILAILAAVAVPTYSGYITRAYEAGDLQMLSAIKTAADVVAIEEEAAGIDKLEVTASGGDVTKIVATLDDDSSTSFTLTSNTQFCDYLGVDAVSDISFDSDTYTYGATWDASSDDGWEPNEAPTSEE